MAVQYPLGPVPHDRGRGRAEPEDGRGPTREFASLGTGIAIGVAPFLLGLLSDTITVRYAFLLVPVLIALAALGLLLARRSDRPVVAIVSERVASVVTD